VIVYLANALAWLSLRDESGLDGHQSGAAITWAIDTLVADLHQRNQRATARQQVGGLSPAEGSACLEADGEAATGRTKAGGCACVVR
jgi:hypothetical protein